MPNDLTNNDEHTRMIRWLAGNRFHTLDNMPSPEIQDAIEAKWAEMVEFANRMFCDHCDGHDPEPTPGCPGCESIAIGD